MSIDKELVETFRQTLQSGVQIIGSEMRQGLDSFRGEVNAGFKEVTGHISQTNARLDDMNSRLDGTNARLDGTNARLDETNTKLEDFRLEVSSKLNGITRLILASEEHLGYCRWYVPHN